MSVGAVLQRSYLGNKTRLRRSYPGHWPVVPLWCRCSLTLQPGFKEIPNARLLSVTGRIKKASKYDLPKNGFALLCAIVP